VNPMHDPSQYNARAGNAMGLGAILLLNLFERLQCGICGPNPVPGRKLTSAVQAIDPGYCLDAPEAMPAGGMANFSMPPFDDDDPPMWLPEQQLCNREDTP
jgi:hypothetical protein